MDSPRRQENEKTDLDMLLRVKGPEFLQKHAANMLLAVVLIGAIVFFFYQKNRNRAIEEQATNQNTAVAFSRAAQLRELVAKPDISDEAARRRQELAATAFAAADQVLSSDSDATQKAAAQLSKAEVLWSLASAPPQALATSQPAAGFTQKSPQAYLQEAYTAYFNILQTYPEQKEVAANALLSLASISESLSRFDEAHEWYSKAARDETIRPIYRDLAKARLEKLADVRQAFVLLAPTTQASTQPSGGATTAPAAVASPATQPAAQ